MREPRRVLASGRDSDILDCGAGLVLRRSRNGRSLEVEARVMRHLIERGDPAPRVEALSADGSELIMERIDGPTMLEALTRQPWTLCRNAAVLASLHDRLHEIPGPDGSLLFSATATDSSTGASTRSTCSFRPRARW